MLASVVWVRVQNLMMYRDPPSHCVLTWQRANKLWSLFFLSKHAFHHEVSALLKKGKSLSRVRLFATPWTAAYQAPPSMGFSKQKYWSGVPSPPPKFLIAAAAKSLQSCPTLCDPIDGSPPGSPIPRILQARTLEWVAISFSNA